MLALRDLKLRYKQTFFGVAWALIQPLAGAAVFSLTLGQLAHLPSDGIPYPVFVYAALVVWTYISGSVSGAAESLVEHRSLVTNVYFPRLIAPLAATMPGVVDLVVSLPVLAIFITGYGAKPTIVIVLLPLWIIGAVALAVSVGILLAALNVQYRDVRYALPFLLQLWFFASPIVYSASALGGAARYAYAINPAVTLIDGFRWSAVGGPPPSATGFVSLGAWIAILCAGAAYFARAERRFADQI